tara:strand:+ start:31 stop:381 length:351 start_codon:yes stop_codon:yes gene_type:complete
MRMLIISLLFVFGCQNNTLDVPDEILSKNKFTTILKEIHLADAEFEINKRNGIKNANDILNNKYIEIYKKNQVTEKIFKKALDYYAEKPEILEQIYINMLGDLKQEKTLIDQQETN